MFIVVGFIVIIVGIVICYIHKSRISKSETHYGTIINLQEKFMYHYGVFTKYCRPVVKYSNGFKEIIAEHYKIIKFINLRHGEGATVLINVDPLMPKSFYFADEERNFPFEAIIAFAFGVTFIVFGIIIEAIILL